jgi:hypothetical protein
MPSSVIAFMHYDPDRSVLRIGYNSGAVYEYKDVPDQVYNKMKNAFSKGEFLNREIKPKYKFEKIK